ncbi:MAG: hypothetical protein AB8C84_08285 [Oligoflexales bacterium]
MGAKSLILVDRDFQMRYTRAAIAAGVASTVLTAVLILYPLYKFEILRIPMFLPWPVLAGMSLAVLVNIGVLAMTAVYISHRVAGPMYSLVRELRRLSFENFTGRMKVRDGDELQYVIRNFNETVISLQQMTQADLDLLVSALELPAVNRGELEALKERLSSRLRKHS